MAEFNKRTLERVFDDKTFIGELRSLLIQLGDDELLKPDNEIDFEFIDECTDALLMLGDENNNNASAFLPLITSEEFIKRFAPKRSQFKRLNTFLRIAVAAALLVSGTLTVNAAVEGLTGFSFLKETGNAIYSVLENAGLVQGDKRIPTANNTELTTAAENESTTAQTSSTTQGETASMAAVTNRQTSIDLISDEEGEDEESTIRKPNIDVISDEDGDEDETTTHTETTTKQNKRPNKREESDIVPDIDDVEVTPVFTGILANFDEFKGDYVYGESIDYENIRLKKLYSDGSTENLPISDTHYTTGIDMMYTHDATIKIVYQKTTVTVDITIRPDEETRGSEICENEDYKYLLTKKGAYVTAYKGSNTTIDLTSLDGNKVFAVASGVFKDSPIHKVTAPDVEKIFANAFENCSSLTNVTLGSRLTYLGNAAFKNTAIKSIALPQGLTEIPESAFEDCKKLESVSMPTTVTAVRNAAFSECTALTAVTGTNNIGIVESDAFYNDELVDFEFPWGLRKAGDCAFYNCKALSVGTLGESLTVIGKEAFAYCYGVTEIKLSDSITDIPEGAFKGTGAKSVTIPEGVKAIDAYAFNGIKAKSLTLPSTVESIGTYALRSVYLTEIHFGNKVKTMKENAVYHGKRLTLFVYKDSVPYQYALDNGLKYELL